MVGSDETGMGNPGLNTITPGQSRAARALLGWSTGRLAAESGLDEPFVRSFESDGSNPPSGQIEALRSALMRAGAEFSDVDGSGVRLSGQGAGDGTHPQDLTTENDR